MSGLTEQLAEFVAHRERLTLDGAVLRTVRTGFIDTIGVMLAGRDEPVTAIVRRFVEARHSTRQDARLLFGHHRAATRDAALVNATAGHALDYDDVGLMGHPSVVLVPALLAEGEHAHMSGMALMRAYVVGYEVWAELASRDQDRLHLKGWHPTAVFGVVAVAAAIAAARRLDAATSRHALAIAASMAGGLIANFGSMTKPFHAGQASAAGIDAVDLAQAGMTAAPDAFEHHAGYLAALSPAGRVDRESPASSLGKTLRIASMGLAVKKYPMCFATHRTLDAMLDLVKAHDLTPGHVTQVRARIGRAQASMLRNHAPVTGLEAKFSLEFAVAAALVSRKVGLAELTDSFVNRPEVRSIFGRVRIDTTDTVSAAEPTLAASDRVVVETSDGRQYDSGEVAGTRGDANSPVSREEMQAKFIDCVQGVPDIDAQALFERLLHLEGVDDVSLLAKP
jgi:2-methylcitrate dehydratase PrpD